jgi:hypothetical protein
MRLHADDPDRITRVIWYRVSDTQKALAGPTPFRSSTWDQEDLFGAIGEISTSRKWWRGGPPPVTVRKEPGLCGSPSQWENGIKASDPPAALDPITGQPLCCLAGSDLPCCHGRPRECVAGVSSPCSPLMAPRILIGQFSNGVGSGVHFNGVTIRFEVGPPGAGWRGLLHIPPFVTNAYFRCRIVGGAPTWISGTSAGQPIQYETTNNGPDYWFADPFTAFWHGSLNPLVGVSVLYLGVFGTADLLVTG